MMTLKQERSNAQNKWANLQERKANYKKFITDNPRAESNVLELLSTDHDIARSMRAYIGKAGKLSEAQVKLLGNLSTRKQKREEQDAEFTTPVPETDTRIAIKGTVASVKWVSTNFGETQKMLVLCEAGYKLYGSVPSSIADKVARGATVAFTAKVQPSRDDKVFGFYSRPTKATVALQVTAPAGGGANEDTGLFQEST